MQLALVYLVSTLKTVHSDGRRWTFPGCYNSTGDAGDATRIATMLVAATWKWWKTPCFVRGRDQASGRSWATHRGGGRLGVNHRCGGAEPRTDHSRDSEKSSDHNEITDRAAAGGRDPDELPRSIRESHGSGHVVAAVKSRRCRLSTDIPG